MSGNAKQIDNIGYLEERVKNLSEWYEWMKGPGSCYPSPMQSLVRRIDVLKLLADLRSELERP